MRTETALIVVLLAVVLAPTWFAAAQPSGSHPGEAEIDTEMTDMRPLQSLIETPQEFTPAQVGIVIWVVLGLLTAVLAVFHRAMHGSEQKGAAGEATSASMPWLDTDSRRIAFFEAPSKRVDGLYVILGLIAATVAFSLLAVMEFATLARTQFVGLYVAGIFFTMAGATAAYSAWFLPDITVAEERYHG
jgi:hypothetical protein